MLIGYARVSKLEQDNELQLRALRKVGVRKIYEEKRSAVKHREQLPQLLDQLRAGDLVVVYKLDRLARSVRDLLNIVDRIESAGATFRSLTESFDTTTPAGKMAFQMLGAVAEFERNIIRERSLAGVEVARSRGVRMGRLPALDGRQSAQLSRQWATGKYTKTELASMHGVSLSTVKRTLWRMGLDTISEAHAHGMLPPTP
ncbi:MAG TPA: recombinase family protein [Burkholderiaceae bacterium]|nr:recombinase family protein [Burkholderiaceae bacterium]